MLNRHGDKLVTEIQTNWKPDMLTCLHLMFCLFAFGRLCVNACICVRVNASIFIYLDFPNFLSMGLGLKRDFLLCYILAKQVLLQ